MKNNLKLPLLLAMVTLIISCGSKDDDCTKTITISQGYFVGNQYHSYDVEMEVPCDFPEPEGPGVIEPVVLANFSYEVLHFEFIPDTGNNTSRLRFEIKLRNGNNFSAEGVPYLTIRSTEIEFSRTYSQEASIPCYNISANSECILTFDKEYPLEPDLINPSFMELVTVKYYLTN